VIGLCPYPDLCIDLRWDRWAGFQEHLRRLRSRFFDLIIPSYLHAVLCYVRPPLIARMTRAAMLDVLGEVRPAPRSQGHLRGGVLLRHALLHAAVPVSP